MNEPLSPAAQAVLDAYGTCNSTYEAQANTLNTGGQRLAAALRAVADQTLPAASPRDRATWDPFAGQIREEILAIAAELESQ